MSEDLDPEWLEYEAKLILRPGTVFSINNTDFIIISVNHREKSMVIREYEAWNNERLETRSKQ